MSILHVFSLITIMLYLYWYVCNVIIIILLAVIWENKMFAVLESVS